MTAEDYRVDFPVIEDEIDAYSRLVQIAKDARALRDEQYWIMGQCAILLETHYADQTLAKFANEIGVEPGRLYEYKVMTEFYDAETRERLKPLDLTYTHMREARRLGSLDKAIEFLHDIAMNLWNVDETRQRLNILLGKAPNIISQEDRAAIYTPPMLQNFHPVWDTITTVTEINGKMTFDTPLPPHIEKGKPYRIIFEPVEE